TLLASTSTPQPPGTASFCVAASAAEKRDYGERSAGRQPPFVNFLLTKCDLTPKHAPHYM
ncbi:hypothetical protein PQR71_37925, partial [Paraburkholderia fungorum]|uniref:hypothetical protein n=1 Tax=Paraburkholderia fungorum TaxID=134537 RepID=UPI0038B8922B